MRHTQVRLDERIQPFDSDRCIPCFQRPLHEAKMNRADDGGSALGQFKERAMSQSDLCLTVGCASLWRESEFVKQSDQAAPCASGGLSGWPTHGRL